MPFPFSLLCLLPLGMLDIDAKKLTIVCLYSYLHGLLSVYANKA